ncbi:hypothetical protein A2917_02740 [Candidatus Nomurabacteria bacterium RIFCSPLOWO2_01_FULL_42_17]|uniref:Uncharacterized protein n=1 Tax=Candidatus Nomurabacteria bacterium RIFCSPLOWO2_01_FULL_42_17 TaxID=1801780 RepID=A0A1F6XN15_9BACT|nr:MAG: hypothetical protein A2917_02740 [Candidatus Nomurabacteria bacterium RIFCSPLOWO2_01_FULL_42_17]
MINLIPKEEKDALAKGFYFRLAVLFLAMLSTSLLVAFVAILPSYFLSSAKKTITSEKLEAQKAEPVPVPDQATLAAIKDLSDKLTLIEKNESNKFFISERVINAIILKKSPSIKITSIAYENDPLKTLEGNKTGKKISIQGSAPSREALLLFRRALEDDSNFQSVDLPISNFVKGSNIQFYLTLIPS